MRKIIDKAIILIICCMFVESSALLIFALLIAISVSSICQSCGKGKISMASELLYIIICFFVPEFLYVLPVVIYDVFSEKRYITAAISGISFLVAFSEHSINQAVSIPIYAALAILLQYRTNNYERLYDEYIRSRDSSAEVHMLLTEKNRQLRENQDYQVYLATLKERNRIAREIHDNVGHLLSRSILQLCALQITDNEVLRNEGLSSLNDTLNNAMTTIRHSVHDLHNDSIDLRAALEEAVKPLSERGLNVNAEFDFKRNIPDNIKFCLISIVKEGVANIVKHSSADSAKIILREHPALYQLIIEDNGVCSENIVTGGIGLSNMRDRISEIGGIIKIDSDKRGFRIFISIKNEMR